MTYTAAQIEAALEKVEHLADLDGRGNYAPLLERLDRELRLARRERRAAHHHPQNSNLRTLAHL